MEWTLRLVGKLNICVVVAYVSECITHFVFLVFCLAWQFRHMWVTAFLFLLARVKWQHPISFLNFPSVRCLLVRLCSHYYPISSHLSLHSRCISSNLRHRLRVNLSSSSPGEYLCRSSLPFWRKRFVQTRPCLTYNFRTYRWPISNLEFVSWVS